MNREIEVTNAKLRQFKARLSKLETWLKDESENTEPPTLADIITNILERREQTGERSRYGTAGISKVIGGKKRNMKSYTGNTKP